MISFLKNLARKAALAGLLLLAGFIIMSPVAQAASVDALIEKLVEKKVLTRIDAEVIRGDISASEKNSFKQFVQETNPWLDGIQAKGDLRLRYEGFGFENEDGRDRDRFRFRLRWGLEKWFNNEFRAGFRLASGPIDEATTTNQSFDDEWNLKNISIDRAYAIWTPDQYVQPLLGSNVKTEIGGGKVANPYEKWGTSIVFDSDVNPEGVYEKFDIRIADVGDPVLGGGWTLHILSGQFVLNENSTGEDSELYSNGIGTTYAWDKNTNVFFNAVYHSWADYERLIASGSVLTASNPAGNDRNVEDFRVVSIYGEYNQLVPTPLGTQPIKVFGHYIRNLHDGSTPERGDDGTGTARAWNADEDQGVSAGVTLGKLKEQGTWESKYQWYYLEPNATPGNFAESDLGLGFANNRGHQLSLGYKIYDNITLQGTYWYVERTDAAVSVTPFTTTVFEDREVSRWQMDVIYAF